MYVNNNFLFMLRLKGRVKLSHRDIWWRRKGEGKKKGKKNSPHKILKRFNLKRIFPDILRHFSPPHRFSGIFTFFYMYSRLTNGFYRGKLSTPDISAVMEDQRQTEKRIRTRGNFWRLSTLPHNFLQFKVATPPKLSTWDQQQHRHRGWKYIFGGEKANTKRLLRESRHESLSFLYWHCVFCVLLNIF